MDFGKQTLLHPQKRLFYPVIHVEDTGEAFASAVIAFTAGADGIFLINHSISASALMHIYAVIRTRFPEQFIGINLLDKDSLDAFRAVEDYNGVSALWVDDSGIGDTVLPYAKALETAMVTSRWPGHYFASTAFKGQPPVSDPAVAAKHCAGRAHVVVTSGPATGKPPVVEKIKRMKAAIPDHLLAIASGIDSANVADFLPHADIFMVATSISRTFTTLDLAKTSDLARIIHAY